MPATAVLQKVSHIYLVQFYYFLLSTPAADRRPVTYSHKRGSAQDIADSHGLQGTSVRFRALKSISVFEIDNDYLAEFGYLVPSLVITKI